MRFVYADYICLHHRDGLEHLLQKLIPFSLPFFGQSLIFFSPSLPFFSLPLPFIHRVHVFIHYPEHSHGHLREAFQAADSTLHWCLHGELTSGGDCITPKRGWQPSVCYSSSTP